MISNQSLDPNRKQKINDFYYFSDIQSDGLHICVTVLYKYAENHGRHPTVFKCLIP